MFSIGKEVTFANENFEILFLIDFFLVLQGDGTTWEIHLGTRLRVKVVSP